MNTFSDEDLKELKRSEHITTRFQLCKAHNKWVSLRDLIARLEAAERIVNAIEPDEVAQVHENFIAWRKAAGK